MINKASLSIIYLIISLVILNPIANTHLLDHFDLGIILYLLIIYLLILYDSRLYLILLVPIIIMALYGIFLFPAMSAYYILIILLLLILTLNVSLIFIVKDFNRVNNYSYRQYISFINAENKINSNRKKRLPVEANAGLVAGSLALQKAMHFYLPGLGFLIKPVITSLFGTMDPLYCDDKLNVELRKLVFIISDHESILLKIYLILFVFILIGGIIISNIYDFSRVEYFILNSQLKNVIKLSWN